jgi:thioredoxin-like negative regulator of GroEL
MHLVEREAFEVAEAQLRRAVWLNPYEPRFKVHLAWCLCRQKRYSEARELIDQLPADWMTGMVADIKRLIEQWQRENSGELRDAKVGDKEADETESRT